MACKRMGGTKDWSPNSGKGGMFSIYAPQSHQSPSARKSNTAMKTVAVVAIAGVFVLAIMQRTGIINIFASK